MEHAKISDDEILKIDELCEAHPFSKDLVLNFARDVSAEAAIYLMNEIIEENTVREKKKMGQIAYAASFRQRARLQKTDLQERMAKTKAVNKVQEEEDRKAAYAVEVQETHDKGFDPRNLKGLSALIAQMGADGTATEEQVSAGLQFISSIAYTDIS